MIRDFKKTTREIRKLRMELDKSYQKSARGTVQEKKTRPSFSFRMPEISLPSLSFLKNIKRGWVFAGVLALLFAAGLFALVFAHTGGSPVYARCSYIGETKLKAELEADPSAGLGGADIRPSETNSKELNFFFYKVQSGDNLSAIAQKLGVTMDTLISLNSMDNAHQLGEGQRIIVPNLKGILYTIRKNDSLEKIAKAYSIGVKDILDANDLEDEGIKEGMLVFLPGAQLSEQERAKVLGYLFMKPLHGRFTSGFGIRRDPFTGGAGYHSGIDIAGYTGAPVVAAKEGTVVYSGWMSGYGLCVIVRHQFGYETVYAHLSSVSVRSDAWVKAGQRVGRVGNTGRSTGPHLHFEVRKFGRPVNPLRISGLGKSGGWY